MGSTILPDLRDCIPAIWDDNSTFSKASESQEQRHKSMSIIHLIGKSIKKYFQDPLNQCEHINAIDIDSILQNILIIGSTPRDYLLNRRIHSIDICVNTRELIKIHLLHLRKYHDTKEKQKKSSNCILWGLYLSKFIDSNFKVKQTSIHEQIIDKNSLKKYDFIADCDFIINARFIVHSILARFSKSLFVNNLTVYRDPNKKIYHCKIESKSKNANSNELDGMKFTVMDVSENILPVIQHLPVIIPKNGNEDGMMHLYDQLDISSNDFVCTDSMNDQNNLESMDSIQSIDSVQSISLDSQKYKNRNMLGSNDGTATSLSMRILIEDDHGTAVDTDGGNGNGKASEDYFKYNNPYSPVSPLVSLSLEDNPLVSSLRVMKFELNGRKMGKNNGRVNGKESPTKRWAKRQPISLEIPFYETHLRDVMKSVDFSINMMTIKMSSVLALYAKDNNKDDEDEKKEMYVFNVRDDADLDWQSIIVSGLDGYDALSDFQNKLITHPNPEDALLYQSFDSYFWSLIRFSIILSQWKIDEKLIAIQQKYYSQWLANDEYWKLKNEISLNNNDEHFVDMMFNNSICRKYKHFKRMLKVFELLDVNKHIIGRIGSNFYFKEYFDDELQYLSSNTESQKSVELEEEGDKVTMIGLAMSEEESSKVNQNSIKELFNSYEYPCKAAFVYAQY